MPHSRDELLKHFKRTREGFLGAIDGLSDDELSEPSLDGWSVKDHLLHIAYWDEIRAAEVSRISAGFDSAWILTEKQDEALNTLVYPARKNLSAAQARWEFETSRTRLLDAIGAATERGLDGSLYGEAALWSTHEVEHAGWIRAWREARDR